MKNNYILSILFVFAIIMSAAFTGNVSAQAGRDFVSSKIITANAPEASMNVVINEVYGGSETGGVYNADFIELYNLSDTAVNISDYSVQYYTAGQINSGAPTSTAHIPAATILQPHSYYVIQVSPATGAGAALPVVDLNASASFAQTGIASDAGKLVLSSTGADLAACTSTSNLVVDRVAWGSTPDFVCNETTNAGQPTTAKSVQRRVGAADTNNNSTDFTASSAPTPGAPQLAPTAASVSIGGRVTTSTGRGIRNVVILMTDGGGQIKTAITGSFGFYSFPDVQAGETYVLTARGKRFTFVQQSQVISINDDNFDVNFTGFPTVNFGDLR